MKINSLIAVLVMGIFVCWLYAKEKWIADLQVLAGQHGCYNAPVYLPLERLEYNQDKGTLRLYELIGSDRIPIPCQLEAGHSARLWWILSAKTDLGTERLFQLVLDDSIAVPALINVRRNEKNIILYKNDKNILQYNHAPVKPPEGADSVYTRSAFIHPLWSPEGHVLTRINPPDHYHHVGIWNPWTKTLFEGQEIDFWNLNKRQGTVRFGGFNSIVEGPVFGGFSVRQEHIVFVPGNREKVALNETWDVRAWHMTDDVWLWDLTCVINCASDSPLLLEAYRYGGGIGFRATEQWTKDNSGVLTSEGKTREQADGTRARWCDINGETDASGRSGVLFMSHPANREHPEPMRVWPLDSNNGRGDVFFEFCPIRHNSWNLLPGKDYVLKYRMLVYDGEIRAEEAERYWNDFAHPPVINLN